MAKNGVAALRTAAIVAAGIAIGGCGPAGHRVGQAEVASTASPSNPGKHVVHGTGHLRMQITPTSGSVGTEVTITATGCGDPNGQNHAVSFNPGFGNTLQAAQAHYQEGAIASHLAGQMLNATYRITTQDARAAENADAPPPRFYVQCATDLADLPFTITK